MFATLPTQFALLFFNVLHPPLNVPALGKSVYASRAFDWLTFFLFAFGGVSLSKDEVDLNVELAGHGISNLLAGALG